MMLSKIFEICKNKPQGANLNEIARKLNKDPIIVEGMVNHLLRMGKLIKHTEGLICDTCPARGSCILLKSTERRFVISMNAVQEYNPDCQELHTQDRGSEIDSS